MSRDPTVSILLPVYNAAETLDEALGSLVAQTFGDFEIVAVDDGSTDGSRELLRAWAGREPRLRVIEEAHRGIVPALQRAAAEARGGFLARMDADDVSLPERLARQVDLLHAEPRLVACGTQVTSFGEDVGSGRERYDDWLNALTDAEAVRRNLFVECPIAHPALMVRRAAFDAAGGYRENGFPEDYDLVLRLALAGGALANVPERLFRWRHTGGRLSLNDQRYAPEAFRAVKRAFLFRLYPPNGRVLYQWGAGSVGKSWLREWVEPRPRAVVDLHPRKIGKAIHDTPVIAPGDLPGPGEAFTVVAVGAPGAREEIRAWFAVRGYRELDDFLFLA